jgi:hypothetical protein
MLRARFAAKSERVRQVEIEESGREKGSSAPTVAQKALISSVVVSFAMLPRNIFRGFGGIADGS